MSDRELERRMLDAAITLVHEQGVSTGLETIAFDEVVRRAGVSRTSAYRRWPGRDRFYGEVLLELASGPPLPSLGPEVLGRAAGIVQHYADDLESAQGRRDLVVELLRITITADYELVSTSPQWRTFHTLVVSHAGIPDHAIRAAVASALASAEQHATTTRARVYAQFAALVGYRLVAPLAGPDGFDLMSRAAGACMTGALGRLDLQGSLGHTAHPMRAFASTRVAAWTQPVYLMAATVLSYLEPDPGVHWTAQRGDDLIRAIHALGEVA